MANSFLQNQRRKTGGEGITEFQDTNQTKSTKWYQNWVENHFKGVYSHFDGF